MANDYPLSWQQVIFWILQCGQASTDDGRQSTDDEKVLQLIFFSLVDGKRIFWSNKSRKESVINLALFFIWGLSQLFTPIHIEILLSSKPRSRRQQTP